MKTKRKIQRGVLLCPGKVVERCCRGVVRDQGEDTDFFSGSSSLFLFPIVVERYEDVGSSICLIGILREIRRRLRE